MKVLLVDDENLVRQSIAHLMRAIQPGLETSHAASAEEMRQRLETEGPFDLIFLDINLFGDDDETGLTLLSKLKDEGLVTPVIMLSNQEEQATVLASIQRGAYGFLPKVSGDEEMARQAIHTVLSGGVYLPSTIHGKGGREPPEGRPTRVREVQASDLKLSPRLYETAYYISQGLPGKVVADKLGITENSAAENSSKVYAHLSQLWKERVTGRADLMAKINKKGIRLKAPNYG